MAVKHLIPSMFHRRLILLLACALAVISVLGAQQIRLSVIQGERHRAEAESRLRRVTYLPTTRGPITDRKGVELAVDRASSDVAVRYDVITGKWAVERARRQAWREIGATRWGELGPEQRQEETTRRLADWDARIDQLWGMICMYGGIDHGELDRRLDAIRREVQSVAAEVWSNQRRAAAERLGLSEEEIDFVPQPILEQTTAHVVLPRVSDEVAYRFREVDLDLPEMLDVRHSKRRSYPWSLADVILDRSSLPEALRDDEPVTIRVTDVAGHMLGAMRDDVWAEDIERRPFVPPGTGRPMDLGGYRAGDAVGSRGVERALERVLRGTRGVVSERRDTGERQRIDALPGRELKLTIDVLLQSRVQAVLTPEFGLARVQPWHKNDNMPAGRDLNAAAVIIEVETGEILSMVSMPEISSDRDRPGDVPWRNRVVEGVYPPGSIIKPLVLAAAVTSDVQPLSAPIACTGFYFPDTPGAARCWIYRERWNFQNHGSLHADEALARSCNIFFYTLADRLGIDRINDWYGRFGIGSVLDCGLGSQQQVRRDDVVTTVWAGENAGELPSVEKIDRMRREGTLRFNTTIMGIGQGPVTWTPLHAANAYATLARGGTIRDATILIDDPRGSREPRCADLDLSPTLVRTTLEGLRQAVQEQHGTGHHIRYDDGTTEPIINADGVTVWAKTGTAQAPPLDLDGDEQFSEIERKLDHSWFVGLVGPQREGKPLFAIAVIVEYGGSGGRVAGPIANQIIHALQEERYLPSEPAS